MSPTATTMGEGLGVNNDDDDSKNKNNNNNNHDLICKNCSASICMKSVR